MPVDRYLQYKQSFIDACEPDRTTTSLSELSRPRVMITIYFIFQLHAVSHTQLGRQRETSVKTLRIPLCAKF